MRAFLPLLLLIACCGDTKHTAPLDGGADAPEPASCWDPSLIRCVGRAGTACVDLATDPWSCGQCGHACGTGASCVGGVCVCPPGSTSCDGTCVKPDTDGAHCGRCGRDCCGGACIGGKCQVATVATHQKNPYGFVTDPTNLYWGSQDGLTILPRGGGPMRLIGPGWIESIAVDGTNVYWADGDSIRKANAIGGSVTTLASGQTYPASVATDGAYVYWVNRSATRSVRRMAVGGGAIETITSADALVDDLIVDGVNAYFVIDVELFAWPTTGGERRLLTAEPVGFGRLAQDATHLYWRTYAGLKRIHKLGPDVVTIRSEPLSQFVVDATNVYWPTSDGIDFAPLADGPSGTAWGGLKTPGNLAIDDRCLYWSEENAIVVAAPKL